MSGILRYAKEDDYNIVSEISTELQNIHAKLRPDLYVMVKNYMEKYEFIEYLNSKRFLIFEDETIKGVAIISIENRENEKVFVIDGLGIRHREQRKRLWE